MPFPAGRRITGALALAALALLGSATISLPASAATPEPGSAAVTGPADGSVLSAGAVTFSATDPDAGYELRWGTDRTVDDAGRLVDVSGGGDVAVRTAEHALVGLDEDTYYWQVRSLDGGPWSPVHRFTVDPDAAGLQLETYPLEEPTAAPSSLIVGVDGRVWIAVAGAFAVVLFGAVVVGILRSRRSSRSSAL